MLVLVFVLVLLRAYRADIHAHTSHTTTRCVHLTYVVGVYIFFSRVCSVLVSVYFCAGAGVCFGAAKLIFFVLVPVFCFGAGAYMPLVCIRVRCW